MSSGANSHGLGDFGGVAGQRMAQDNGAGEYSYGAGLDVPGFEGKPPAEGGRYVGTSPPCERIVGIERDIP